MALAEARKFELTEHESYWLTHGWKTLRRQLSEVAWREARMLIACIEQGGAVSSRQNDEFFLKIYKVIEPRARNSEMWAAALDLFPFPIDLSPVLNAQRAALTGQIDVSPVAAFKAILRRPLEEARRSILPGSVQRRKNWETIDRISRSLFDGSLPQHYRNSIEHAEAVSNELAGRFPSSRNLRLSPGSVKQYFDDFLPNAMVDVSPENLGLAEVTDLDSERDADLLRRLDIASVVLDDCIKELDEIHCELLNAVYGVGSAGNVVWESATAFRRGRNLSRYAFDILHEQALTELQHRLNEKAVL